MPEDLRGANQSLAFSPDLSPSEEAAAAAAALAAGDCLAPLGRVGSPLLRVPPPPAPPPEAADAEGADDLDDPDDAGEADEPDEVGEAGEPDGLFAASAAPSPTGVRMTTGGMGREPGMLIRIRVVIVVSVFGSPCAGVEAGEAEAAPVSSPDGVPYGGVPEG